MLRILGSHKRLCDGFSRRDFLQAGGLGLLGLGTQSILSQPPAVSAEATAAHGPSTPPHSDYFVAARRFTTGLAASSSMDRKSLMS